ncbi:hypothetical protein KFL_000220050 [Klebsormidium nitens]|uniref:Uncharacterized protein n=1 Tax=Klebsormidium nitens TaxID=105231 RepID=A0A1Y1HLV8_KLENI|nr:hypothetical protein KFL_000220050 [Klebsormidium nitens]|eukprot:GAQ78973.1 hypothetical protein KFL_000220050 [Klebsormidium nitens]
MQRSPSTLLRSSLSEDNRPGSNPGVKLQRTRNVLESVYQMSAVENPRDPVLDTSKAAEVRGVTVAAPTISVRTGGEECSWCDREGSIECMTCAGSGLYVEPCLESAGVIVKVTCLGCGGSGRILCPHCGGRRHH